MILGLKSKFRSHERVGADFSKRWGRNLRCLPQHIGSVLIRRYPDPKQSVTKLIRTPGRVQKRKSEDDGETAGLTELRLLTSATKCRCRRWENH